jgi:hypothetical protein
MELRLSGMIDRMQVRLTEELTKPSPRARRIEALQRRLERLQARLLAVQQRAVARGVIGG